MNDPPFYTPGRVSPPRQSRPGEPVWALRREHASCLMSCGTPLISARVGALLSRRTFGKADARTFVTAAA